MPTPPNMLRPRTRGITRLSWSMTKVRKLELTGTRHDLHVFGVRLTDRAKAAGDSPAGARVVDAVRAPPEAQHSASSRAISARQLQALVRQRPGHARNAPHDLGSVRTR